MRAQTIIRAAGDSSRDLIGIPLEQSVTGTVSPINEMETSVPNSLQYPLERQRDLQRRWNRLLQRTVAPKDHSAGYPRVSPRNLTATRATFREPIATLLLDGKTVGRHYAGPNWEHADGSAVVAKVA